MKWEYTFPLKLLSHSLLHCYLVSLPARQLVKCTEAKVSFFLSASLTQPTLLCSLASYYFTALDIFHPQFSHSLSLFTSLSESKWHYL